MNSTYRIEALQESDWDMVRAIYLEGIATGHATFEQTAPSWASWNESRRSEDRFAARFNDSLVGWATLSDTSDRCVYSGVAEVSVYVAIAHQGQGVGTLLLQALINASESRGIWTLQAGIFPENVGSIALHKRCGFREVGRRERLGQMNGTWRDVLLMERRSSMVGL